MLRRIRKFVAQDRGTALIEFALVLPVMISLFMGVFEVTRVVSASMRLMSAAQAVADMIAQQSDLSPSEMTNFCNGGKLSMTPLSGASLKVAVASVTHKSSGTAVDWNDVTCGSATTISNATTLVSTLVPNTNDSVIIVQASYAYTSPISYVLASSFTLTQTAYQRPYNVTTTTHS